MWERRREVVGRQEKVIEGLRKELQSVIEENEEVEKVRRSLTTSLNLQASSLPLSSETTMLQNSIAFVNTKNDKTNKEMVQLREQINHEKQRSRTAAEERKRIGERVLAVEKNVVQMREKVEIRKGERRELEASLNQGNDTLKRLEDKLMEVTQKVERRAVKKSKLHGQISKLEKKIDF